MVSFRSLRTKIALTFILIVIIIGIINGLLGIRLIAERVIKEAQSHVQADLNSAHEIYQGSEQNIANTIRLTANRFFIRQALLTTYQRAILTELKHVVRSENLDFLTLTDSRGNVLIRTGNVGIKDDNIAQYNIINRCIIYKTAVAGTELFPAEYLLHEDSSLAPQAHVTIIPTPRAKYQREGVETTGMMICAAAPIFDVHDNFIAILFGGKMVNNNFDIVDKIKSTVFLGEKYKNRDIGTATVFMKDLRISTNVMKQDGTRAIGTLVSKEVYEAVIENGLFWIDRAFVVNDWYITAYQPIRNTSDEIIGILYVGILEKKYSDIKNQIIVLFTVITVLGMTVVLGFSYLIANNVTKPLRNIAGAARKIAQGNFPDSIPVRTNDEIADLSRAIQYMITSLKERDEKLKESVSKTVAESERLATVGQLAAGVAHEINNPLTGILLYCDLVLQDMKADHPQRHNLEKISTEAKRCSMIVKGLLDFSRPKKPEIKVTSIDQVLRSTLSLIQSQALFQNIALEVESDSSLPPVKIDPHQIQQVFMNLLINAAEAMNGKGRLTIRTRRTGDAAIMIQFEDTGPGISEENLQMIFEPFFTTKEATHGVGLGLAISRRIIMHHGGRMEVESQVNRGATFTIILPIT